MKPVFLENSFRVHRRTGLAVWLGCLGLLAGVCAAGISPAREGTEWETVYWYNANESKLPRVLLVGDSIVKGYQEAVRNNLAGEAYVAFLATSKSADDPAFLRELAYVLDEYPYAVIHFNNGLHSLTTDPAKWQAGLRAAVKLIREKGGNAKLIWATSTPLKDDALTRKVRDLNALAAPVMAQNGIGTDDVFALMDGLDRARYWVDNYHVNADASRMEAEQVTKTLRAALGTKPASATAARESLNGAATETGPSGRIDPAATLAGNVVRNPGFEEDGAWSVYPPEQATTALNFDADHPHSGGRAAKITVDAGEVQFYQSAPALEPGRTYRLTCWLRASETLTAQVWVRTRKPPYVYAGQQTLETGTGWQRYEMKIVTPRDYQADANALFFSFPTKGTYWLDDVTVEPAGDPK